MQELTMEQVEEVSGGIAPAFYGAAFIIGLLRNLLK